MLLFLLFCHDLVLFAHIVPALHLPWFVLVLVLKSGLLSLILLLALIVVVALPCSNFMVDALNIPSNTHSNMSNAKDTLFSNAFENNVLELSSLEYQQGQQCYKPRKSSLSHHHTHTAVGGHHDVVIKS